MVDTSVVEDNPQATAELVEHSENYFAANTLVSSINKDKREDLSEEKAERDKAQDLHGSLVDNIKKYGATDERVKELRKAGERLDQAEDVLDKGREPWNKKARPARKVRSSSRDAMKEKTEEIANGIKEISEEEAKELAEQFEE